MSFTVPSRDTLNTEGVSDYSASQPDKSVSRGSIPWLLMRTVSGLAWSILARLLGFDKNRLPDTADKDNLQRWGNAYEFPPLGPVGASRALALRVSGTVGAAITTDAQLTHPDGTIYKVDTVGAVVGAPGYTDVDVSAVSRGIETNKIAGESLTFSAPPLNVTAVAVLVLNLTDGADAESTEAYRVRLLAHLGDPPEGGAAHDYIEWALQVPGNASAYLWRARRGLGTLDVAVLGNGHGADRVVTDLDPTQLYLDDPTRRPGNVKDVLVLTLDPQEQDAKVVIEQDATKYSWDWTDDGTGYVVDSAVEGDSTITGTTFPAAIVAGVRIQVDGEEATVTLRVSNTLTLAFAPDRDGTPVTWFTFNPVGEPVRASGDLVTPVRNAILDLFDRLGPARDTRYALTYWESSLQTDSIIAAARNVIGCTKATVDTPNADVVPEDPLNGSTSIPFLVPGTVEVVQS